MATAVAGAILGIHPFDQPDVEASKIATRKLTVNMGLRWDFFQVPHDVNKKWRSLRLDILSTADDGRKLPTMVPGPNQDDRSTASSVSG